MKTIFNGKLVPGRLQTTTATRESGALGTQVSELARALRGGRNALLNAASLARALRLRPDATLSMHIVTSPAAAAIRRATGARTVQYFHAEEIGAKPRLAAFAASSADASIAVSAYTAGLITATGAESLHRMPRGLTVLAG